MTTKTKTDLLDTVKEMVRNIGDEFTTPEADWDPTIWVQDDDEKVSLVLVNGDDPINLADSYIQKHNPARAISLFSVWRNNREYEELMLLDSVRGAEAGEAGRIWGFTALITRHENKPPTLGPWVEMTKQDEEAS